MKNISKYLLTALVSVALAMTMTACGGGGSSDGGGGGGGGAITTNAQGSSASASAAQSTSLASNSGVSLSNIAEGSQSGPGASRFKTPLAVKDAKFNKVHAAQTRAMKVQKKKLASALKKAKAAVTANRATVTIPATDDPCEDSGKMTFNGDYDDVSGVFNLTMTYYQCRELDEELNGATSVSGVYSTSGNDTITMKLGDADGTIESTDFMARLFTTGYGDVYATYIADMTLTGSVSCSNAACDTFTSTLSASGTEKYDDYINVYTFTYSSFSFTGSDTTTTAGYTASYTINGGISEAWTSGSTAEGASVTFTTFVLTFTDTATYYEETADGTVTLSFTPADYCFAGTFTIDTVTPVRTSYATGLTTQGNVVINGNVTIVYNPDGTITVTVTGQTSDTFASNDAFEVVCDLQEQEAQDSTVTTVSTGGTTTTTGTTLLATLTWTGTGCPTTTGCTSDMDLHLMHYADTAPTSASTVDFHIYFADQDGTDLSVNPLPNDDVNTPVICTNNDCTTGDVIGGYEGNLDYDDTEGDGPEHLTVSSLPVGYYLLYVDPWGMDFDATATVKVSLKIGSNAYTFPTYMFNGTSSADYRVCDVKVAVDGVVTILTPNTGLTSLAPALNAQKVRR
ncbi:MAG: hypothetical protein M0R70_01500 [Nitrospirae bacterium]|nr:hypothetical protein [Nitrospirota bacterium]